MGRALLVIANDLARRQAIHWLQKAPWNTRVEFKGPKRTLPQNDLMWALLTKVSMQATWHGKKRSPDDWKDLFTGALKSSGDGLDVVPGLEGGFMLLGLRTSDLSIPEMADLITYIQAWSAANGVDLSEASAAEDGGASALPHRHAA